MKKLTMQQYFRQRIAELEQEYQERMDQGDIYFAARAMDKIVELGRAYCRVQTCEDCTLPAS